MTELLDPDERGIIIAGNITLDHERKMLLIDGNEFMYALHKAGPQVAPDPDDPSPSPLCVVTLPVICETYDVIGEPDES
jgi:hypothetical protein